MVLLGKRLYTNNYRVACGVKVVEMTRVAPLGMVRAFGRGKPEAVRTGSTSFSRW